MRSMLRPRRWVRLAGVAIAGTALAACVMPDQLAQLQKDVSDIQQELRAAKRQQEETQAKIAELETKVSAGDPVTRTEFADLKLNLENNTRRIAVLDEQLSDANRRMDRMSHDVEEAKTLSQRAAGRVPSPAASAAAAGAGETPPDAATAQSAGGEALPDPEALYNAAYADFSKGNYALAISGFEEYSERFPDSDLADNALYWIGECKFSQGDFSGAVEAFDRMLEKYPRSDRAAAADLKKGLAYLELNQVGKAIVQLRYVVSQSAGSDEARVARDKLISLGAAVQ